MLLIVYYSGAHRLLGVFEIAVAKDTSDLQIGKSNGKFFFFFLDFSAALNTSNLHFESLFQPL